MKKPSEPRNPQPGSAPHARRAWTKPQVVVYGHLAKLTRTGSGMYADSPGGTSFQKTMCL